MLDKNIDCLVLGCTHYPYLIPKIREIIGDKIQIIDSGLAVAKQTKRILEQHNLLNNNLNNLIENRFYINQDKSTLVDFLQGYSSIDVQELDF